MTCLSADALRTDPQGLAFLHAVLRAGPAATVLDAPRNVPFAGGKPAPQPAAKIPAGINA